MVTSDTYLETLAEVLEWRNHLSCTLFVEPVAANISLVKVKLDGGFIYTEVAPDDPTLLAVMAGPYINKPVMYVEERLHSHDFADSTTWQTQSPLSSIFSLTAPLWTLPVIGPVPSRLVIHTLKIVFPENATFDSSNKAFIKFYQSLDGVTPVDENTPPSMEKEFPDIRNFLQESITTEHDYTPSGAYTRKTGESFFYFTDPLEMGGRPVILKYTLGEHFDIGFSGDTELKDKDGLALDDPCEAIFYCNKMIQF